MTRWLSSEMGNTEEKEGWGGSGEWNEVSVEYSGRKL